MAFIASKNFQKRRFHHFPAGLWAQQHDTCTLWWWRLHNKCLFFFFQNPFGSVFPFVEYYQNKICHKTLGGREKPKDTGKAKDKDSERAEV